VDRYWKEDQQQTEEQRLLAKIVSDNWKDDDHWWVGAFASSNSGPFSEGSLLTVVNPQKVDQ
jgi:hypothetical protein